MGVEAGARRAARRRRRRARRRLLRDRRPRLPRQDQRHRDPRRARPRRLGAAAFDMLGSVRSGVGRAPRRARRAAGRRWPCSSDVRTGLPGGGDERDGGDAAVAFLCGPTTRRRARARRADRVRRPRRRSSSSAGGVPGERASRQWEERFGEHVYVPLGRGGADRGAEAGGRDGGRRSTTLDRRRAARARGQARGGARPARRRAGDRRRPHRRPSATRAPRTPGSCSPTRSTAPQADQTHRGRLARRRRRRRRSGARPARWRRAARAVRGEQVAGGGRVSLRRRSSPGAASSTASRRGGPIPSAPAAPPSFRAEAWKFALHRQPLPGVRHAPPAAAARVREVPRRRPHDARAHGRRAGDHRDVHRRPAGLLALAAGGGGRDRLRGRRPVPVRADRRGSQGGEDRRPRRDDLPPALHRRAASTTTSGRPARGAEARWRSRDRGASDMASNGIRDRVAIVGMGCTPFGEHWDKSVERPAGRRRRGGPRPRRASPLDDVDAFWLGTLFSGQSGLTLSRPLKIDYKPVSRLENYCATGSEAFRNACYAVASGAYDVAMAIGVEKLKDSGFSGLARHARRRRRHRARPSPPPPCSACSPRPTPRSTASTRRSSRK